MAKPASIFVTAPAGRLTPVHPNDRAEVDDGYVRPGRVSRVKYFRADGGTSQTIRRAVLRGDLIRCDMSGREVDSFEAAIAPDEDAFVAAKKGAAK